MVIAAVFCVFQGLAYAEVGSAYPVAGGEYSMVGRVLGKALGIITFGLMSAMYIFVPTAAALAAGSILGIIWPWAGEHTHIIAVLVIVYAASVSFLKVKLGTWVAAFFVAVQIIALLIVTVLGLVHAHSPSERLFSTQAIGADGNMTTVAMAAAVLGITVAFFIYQGFGQRDHLLRGDQEGEVQDRRSSDGRHHHGDRRHPASRPRRSSSAHRA